MLKLYSAIDESKERVVLTNTNVFACANCGASLSYDNVTGNNLFAAELLYTETLGFAVTAVLGRTNTLFVCKEL